METRILRSIALVISLAAACLVAPVAPAYADLPVPPGGGCSLTQTHKQVSSTKEQISVRLRCPGKVAAIGHYVTFQRSGKAIKISRKECVNYDVVSPFSCTVTYTATDPAGTQKFETYSHWDVYYSPLPFCSPNGEGLPECIQDVGRGQRYGGSFTS